MPMLTLAVQPPRERTGSLMDRDCATCQFALPANKPDRCEPPPDAAKKTFWQASLGSAYRRPFYPLPPPNDGWQAYLCDMFTERKAGRAEG